MNNKAQNIDIANIGLLVLSVALAINIPFKLFVYAYAFIGPLHYLTEINWLSEKNFFTKRKADFMLLGICCVLVTSSMMLSEIPKIDVISAQFRQLPAWLSSIHDATKSSRIHLVSLAFIAALSFVLFEDWKRRMLLIGTSVAIGSLIYSSESYALIVGLFIPTLIHVCLFTWLFMLFGAMKSASKTGYIGCLFYLICVVFILIHPYNPVEYEIDKEFADVFAKSNFHIVNFQISSLFATIEPANFKILSPLAIKIQSFIAFSYAYHYLNWFSKTGVIGWHKVSMRKNVVTLVLWATSVGSYLIDYKLGFVLLLFLSFLHVFLEFPLNHLSIIGIGKHLFKQNT